MRCNEARDGKTLRRCSHAVSLPPLSNYENRNITASFLMPHGNFFAKRKKRHFAYQFTNLCAELACITSKNDIAGRMCSG